jgi:hypothetical protein
MYKSKHTGEQVDRLLKDVFDSTLQTKDINVTENGVIEVTPDEGYLGLAKVNVNVEVPTDGGSGGELEGEYYLAKPSGKYWKFTCADHHLQGGVNIPFIKISNLTDEEYQALKSAFYSLPNVVYSAVCASEGIPIDGSYIITSSFVQAVIRVSQDADRVIQRDDRWYIIGAFQDCSGEIEGIKFNGLINLMQVMMLVIEGIEISEEEAILMISEMFMLEQITKEEYESYYNWNRE